RGVRLVAEDCRYVLIRLSRVDHHWEATLDGECKLFGEHLALHAAGRMIVVVVESHLAGCHTTAASPALREHRLEVGVPRVGIVRMAASGQRQPGRVGDPGGGLLES